MQPHLRGVEGQAALHRDQPAIEYELARIERTKIGQHLGKEARERLSRSSLDLDRAARPEAEAAKPVPLRFELPSTALRQFRDQARLPGPPPWAPARAVAEGSPLPTCPQRLPPSPLVPFASAARLAPGPHGARRFARAARPSPAPLWGSAGLHSQPAKGASVPRRR